jgi:flagellar basal body-associated protein FliL
MSEEEQNKKADKDKGNSVNILLGVIIAYLCLMAIYLFACKYWPNLDSFELLSTIKELLTYIASV